MEAREQVSSKMSARGKGVVAAKFQLITTTWKSEPSAARFLIFQEMLFLLGQAAVTNSPKASCLNIIKAYFLFLLQSNVGQPWRACSSLLVALPSPEAQETSPDFLHLASRQERECGELGERFQGPRRKWCILLLPTFPQLGCGHTVPTNYRDHVCWQEKDMGLVESSQSLP